MMILIGASALLLAIAAFYRWLIYEAVEEKHQLLDVDINFIDVKEGKDD